MTVQTASAVLVREILGHVAPYMEPEVVDAIADRVAAQSALNPLYARVTALETGLREACDHIDDLHLPDLGLRAEAVRLRALAGKP